MMKSLLIRYTFILMLCSALVVAGGIGLARLIQAVHTQQIQVVHAKQQLMSYEQHRQIILQQSKRVEVIKERLATLDGYRTTAATQELIASLQALATQSGVTLTIGPTQTPTSPDTTPKRMMAISVVGTWEQVHAFLDVISRQTYRLALETMTLSVDTKTSQTSPTAKPKDPLWNLKGTIRVMSY